MSNLKKSVESVSVKQRTGTLLDSILESLPKDDSDYLIHLLRDTDTPCSIIHLALHEEGYSISERTLQKERVKLGSTSNS